LRTRYLAARVLPDAEGEISPGAVVVEGERIAWVGPASDCPDADATVDLEAAVLLPGLVNAHSHLDLTHLRGQVPYEDEFALWAERVMEGRRLPGMRAAATDAIRDALARGTTTFGDIVTPAAFPEVLQAFTETGARARLFIEALGFHPDRADQVFERVWELAEMKALPVTVETGLSPHAPYSVSRPLLARLVALAEGHGRPLAIHVAETLEELAFLRHGIGPLRELLRRHGADDPGYQPYSSLPDFLRLLDVGRASLLLVHCNYLRPRDVPARAFVVYCPTAHAFFHHPEHPALEFLEEGVRVVLGSDSAASGSSVDLLSETQHLARARPDLTSRTVFRMATEWGARALGIEAGKLEAGALADLAAFTPPVGHAILGSADARCVLAVVGGRVLYREEASANA